MPRADTPFARVVNSQAARNHTVSGVLVWWEDRVRRLALVREAHVPPPGWPRPARPAAPHRPAQVAAEPGIAPAQAGPGTPDRRHRPGTTQRTARLRPDTAQPWAPGDHRATVITWRGHSAERGQTRADLSSERRNHAGGNFIFFRRCKPGHLDERSAQLPDLAEQTVIFDHLHDADERMHVHPVTICGKQRAAVPSSGRSDRVRWPDERWCGCPTPATQPSIRGR